MDKKDLDVFEEKIEDSVNERIVDSLLDSDALFDTSSDYDLSSNTAKEKISKLPWLVAFFLIVIISITLCAMFLNSNPQTIFTMAIDKFFSSISNSINDNAYDISKGKINIDFDVSGNKDSDFYKELSKNDFYIDYVLYNSGGQAFFKVKNIYDGNNSLNLKFYKNQSRYYLYLNDIYDKYIMFESDDTFNVIRSGDLKKILDGLNQAFDKVATSEKIIGSKTALDFDIKSLKVYETKLTINESNYKRVSNTFINSLKSNEEFVNSVSNLFNISTNSVNEKLDKLEKKLKNYFKKCETLDVKLYTDRKSNDFIKGIFVSKNEMAEIIKKDNGFSYVLNSDYLKLDGSLNLTINKQKTKYNLDLDVNYNNQGEIINGRFNIIYTNNKASSFKKVDVKNYIKSNDLSDEDKLSIYSKLFSNPIIDYYFKK